MYTHCGTHIDALNHFGYFVAPFSRVEIHIREKGMSNQVQITVC
jgi:kynurenine formamidase